MRLLAILGSSLALLSMPAAAAAQGAIPPFSTHTGNGAGELRPVELLGLSAIAVLLFVAVGVLIVREGRGGPRSSGRKRARARPRSAARPDSAGAAARGNGPKAPPPPPRKRRRQKAKRR